MSPIMGTAVNSRSTFDGAEVTLGRPVAARARVSWLGEGMSLAVVVGNPQPKSRTYQAAHLVAARLADRPADLSVDLTDLGAALLDWSDSRIAAIVATLAE